MASQGDDLIAILARPHLSSEYSSSAHALDALSRNLGSNRNLRTSTGQGSPSIWEPLEKRWQTAADVAERGVAEDQKELVISLARFTRNLVADVPHNQEKAIVFEPSIRRLIRVYTAWTHQDDIAALVATQTLTQVLSNIVTGNEPLQNEVWGLYIVKADESSILLRLVESHDPRTLVSLMVLLLNCVSSSSSRSAALARAATGTRLIAALLDKMETYLEEEEASRKQVFELGYALFSTLFTHGQFPEMYKRTGIEDEAVSPPQMILLKLLDAYLQSRSGAMPDDDLTLPGTLTRIFQSLSDFVQTAIQLAVGGQDESPLSALDLQLPVSCAALVLVTQCLVSVLLGEAAESTRVCKDTILGLRPGAIESIPETLRLLDIFLPRITFGKATPSPAASRGGVGNPAVADATGFQYVKRDLVRLLGTLAHEDRSVQDRARESGGILAVLNLCVIDERNPYLREHAIFALRNLLHENSENQAIVAGLQPQGAWGASGDFTDGVTRRD